MAKRTTIVGRRPGESNQDQAAVGPGFSKNELTTSEMLAMPRTTLGDNLPEKIGIFGS